MVDPTQPDSEKVRCIVCGKTDSPDDHEGCQILIDSERDDAWSDWDTGASYDGLDGGYRWG